ncbi:toll/interleukin-1 receptor domain-containing protein [Clostridium perfringens]|uniref:toll/interleukin-1 receptor domain-containing protein n=1 Tax=Clostridium perfringens TaxID=1502 RepID=UPI001CB53C9E|nr:toll/interleukin-1 receptor domain-containing protein [Clostridium perfringens]MDK0678548.1 toll/interleukin-1 receptor domain-containing protein [Clostridium perfringens]MDM0577238.1 toll/interleukin-1 receptor domain-containing protein [Clostridium perfringens]MDM0579552.1 toll/interleukin-1 receptor domain-containing protein [Clostridium perfringens]MDM0586269.1 toll/interleukin-1 receptor domain-containing protein [Clostridium perfringens]MDM0589197.1 toll/interleukin-1 receptor domain-
MENNQKTVFISYCWTTLEHEKWVIELAEKLLSVGVDVKLDKWDLVPGNDTYAFMEQMVTNPDIDKVLIICDKGYKTKADGREGGVGTETKIITPEIYRSVNQEKFIPIIVEKDEDDFMKYVPTYARNMLGINMTSEECFGESFEELLRCIYKKPRYKKPALGNNMPSFLKDDEEIIMSVVLKLKNEEIKKYIDKDIYNKVLETSNDFRDNLIEELEKFIILDSGEAQCKCKNYIDDLKDIRDQYLIRVKRLIGYVKDEDLEDIIVEDLEKLYKFVEYQGSGLYNNFTFGHFSFLIHEIFLWICTLLFKYKKYELISKLLTCNYYVDSKSGDNKKNVGCFYDRIGIVDSYKTQECDRISLNADKIIERSILDSKNYKRELIIVDLMLYYATIVNKDCKGHWFPRLYIYNERYSRIKEFDKMSDKKYFDKIKCIFGFESLDELIAEFDKAFPIGYRITGYASAFDGIPHPQYLINIKSN